MLIAVAFVSVLIAPMGCPRFEPASGPSRSAVLGVLTCRSRCWQQFAFAAARRCTPSSVAKAPRIVASATVMSILVQVGVVALWLVGMSLGREIPVSYYCILGPMVSLLMLLPISVNGMGVRG